jgi:hypothetical protein
MQTSPSIIIDTREQQPLVFQTLPATRGTLQTGDYSILGAEEHFAVERKSLEDLASSSAGPNRERFERELHRLRGYRFKRLLSVGTEQDIQTAGIAAAFIPTLSSGVSELGRFATFCPLYSYAILQKQPKLLKPGPNTSLVRFSRLRPDSRDLSNLVFEVNYQVLIGRCVASEACISKSDVFDFTVDSEIL